MCTKHITEPACLKIGSVQMISRRIIEGQGFSMKQLSAASLLFCMNPGMQSMPKLRIRDYHKQQECTFSQSFVQFQVIGLQSLLSQSKSCGRRSSRSLAISIFLGANKNILFAKKTSAMFINVA
jgi:hypothetical protein